MKVVLPACLCMNVAVASVSFASIGDWGGASISTSPDDYHRLNELAVAKQLGKTMGDVDAKFVINTGDNFYYCGVKGITDEQFKTDFENVFTDKSTFVPWYGVLGNHDYAFNPTAQFNYTSPNNDRWQLPSYYYTKRILLGGAQYATFIFIDSNPCIAAYRGSDPKGWDPCSGDFGDECAESPGDKCDFHDHIMTQDCSAQLAWFKKELAAVDENDWLFVVGHHEADQIDVEDFTAEMLSSKMRLYLNGHTHALKHYHIDSRTDIDWFTTGAGCMVHTKDQDTCTSALCGVQTKHTAKEIYYGRLNGFTVHTFSDDFSSLTTNAFDVNGKVVHTFVTAKSGSEPAPGEVVV